MYKKTVTFTSKVSNFTDGTVSAQIQAENDIVNQLAQWLLLQMPSMQQLEKVSIGDEMWAHFPMYAEDTDVPDAPSYDIYNIYKVLTDVFIFGVNTNNFCCGLCADNHILRFAPTSSFAKAVELNTATPRKRSIPQIQLRQARVNNNRVYAKGALDLFTFPTTSDDIVLELEFWKSATTLIISSKPTRDFVYFTALTESTTGGFGFARSTTGTDYANFYNTGACFYSFYESLQASTEQPEYQSRPSKEICLTYNYSTSFNPYFWMSNNYAAFPYTGTGETSVNYYIPTAVWMHTLPIPIGMQDPTTQFIVPTYFWYTGFPRIDYGQICMRKVLAPNLNIDTGLKLVYTPGMLYRKSIYLVNDKAYLCFGHGWCSGFIEVADQG